jgi:hypothetical protein
MAKVAIAQFRETRQILVTTALKPIVANPHNANWMTATRTTITVAVFTKIQFGRPVATLYCATETSFHEELTVANNTMSCIENNELVGTSTKRGSGCSRDALTLPASAEVYGGGTDYFPFWRLPLWPLSWIRFLAQEEE